MQFKVEAVRGFVEGARDDVIMRVTVKYEN